MRSLCALGLLVASTIVSAQGMEISKDAVPKPLRPPTRSGEKSEFEGIAAAPFTNLSNPEKAIGASLPTVPNLDFAPKTFGKSTGEVAVLGIDDFRLWTRKSTDGGATFGSEVAVGGVGVADTHLYDARLSADGKLYVAMLVVGAAGGIELRATRSDDMGLTWSTPALVVGEGSDAFSVFAVRLATGPTGRAAVILRGHDGTRLYVCATIDSGATWTAPVRIDGGAPATSRFPYYGEPTDIAVDNANRILAVYAQNRGAADTVFLARSIDDGATFSAETAVTLPSHRNSSSPEIEVANDGSALLALWDDEGNDHLYVLRSTTGGSTWTTVVNRLGTTDSDIPLSPRISVDPATATVLMHCAEANARVSVTRGALSGATWGLPTDLAGSAYGNGFSPTFGLTEARRTAVNTWVIAWEDKRSDTYIGQRTDVYARASTDDGFNWGAEVRVDSGTAGSATSSLGGLTAHSANNVYLVYSDGKDDSGRSRNVYGNRSTVPLAFAADVRLDSDASTRQPPSGFDRSVTTDGGTHVYVAFPARVTGPFPDIYLATSADSGATFGSPVRVGTVAAGSRINVGPVVRAFSDGRVYLLYDSDAGTISELRFNRSTDFGATWQANDFVVGTFPRSGYEYRNPQDNPRLEVTSDGTVYVAWSGDGNVRFRKSTDFGATWGTTSDIDQSSPYATYPLLCASGDELLLTYAGYDATFTGLSIWGSHSFDRGTTWSPRVDVRAAASALGMFLYDMGCAPAGKASMVWSEVRTGTTVSQYAVRYDGGWGVPVLVPSVSALAGDMADVEFLPAGTALAAYELADGSVWVGRSTDGGATYPTSQRLDDAVPRPDANSWRPLLAVDASGNVWASFLDGSVGGLQHFAARVSTDQGLTWGAVSRVETYEPQGARDVESAWAYTSGKAVAALPGVGLFAWGAERATQTADVLFNRWTLGPQDGDGDGRPSTTDCNDANPGVWAVPVEVAAVRVQKVSGSAAARLEWTSQDASAGPASSYDVVTGVLSELRADAGFARVSCLQAAHPDTPYDDVRPGPFGGAGWYYLIRAKNVCGTATFGRPGMDGITICP